MAPSTRCFWPVQGSLREERKRRFRVANGICGFSCCWDFVDSQLIVTASPQPCEIRNSQPYISPPYSGLKRGYGPFSGWVLSWINLKWQKKNTMFFRLWVPWVPSSTMLHMNHSKNSKILSFKRCLLHRWMASWQQQTPQFSATPTTSDCMRIAF